MKVEELGARRVLSVLLTCCKSAGDALLGSRVIPENFIWCFGLISLSGIGWKPSLTRAFRNRGLACSAADTLRALLIAVNRASLSASDGR